MQKHTQEQIIDSLSLGTKGYLGVQVENLNGPRQGEISLIATRDLYDMEVMICREAKTILFLDRLMAWSGIARF